MVDRHSRIAQSFALALLLTPLFGASPARGADFCLDTIGVGSPAFDISLESFRMPRRGTCKSALGVANPEELGSAVTGAACTSSDGQRLSLTLTVGVSPSFGFYSGRLVFHTMILDVPSLTGRDSIFDSGVNTLHDLRAYVCNNGFLP